MHYSCNYQRIILSFCYLFLDPLVGSYKKNAIRWRREKGRSYFFYLSLLKENNNRSVINSFFLRTDQLIIVFLFQEIAQIIKRNRRSSNSLLIVFFYKKCNYVRANLSFRSSIYCSHNYNFLLRKRQAVNCVRQGRAVINGGQAWS